MPWCSPCGRFLSPSTVRPDGSCPACGHPVDPGGARPGRLGRLPWHLKLLLAVFAVYLAFRLAQGLDWLVGRL